MKNSNYIKNKNINEDIEIFIDNNPSIVDLNGYGVVLGKLTKFLKDEDNRNDLEEKLNKKLQLNSLLEKEKYSKNYLTQLNNQLDEMYDLLNSMDKTVSENEIIITLTELKKDIEMHSERIGDELIMIREEMKGLYNNN